MEQNTKLIVAAVGLGGLGYFLYKKGFFGQAMATAPVAPIAPAAPVAPTSTTTKTTPAAPAAPVYTYPTGYSELDYVRNPSGDGTVFMLKKGQKLPITYAWWMANAKLDWDKVKDMNAGLLMDIPTGTVLDA
jgi:hypothetical protein